MREFKFRAWDKDNLIMIENIQEKQGYLFGDFLNNERFIVEQYIGFNDADNKEIYEGDILRYPARTDWDVQNYSCHEVFWKEFSHMQGAGWVFAAHFVGEVKCCMKPKVQMRECKKMKIIGNFHEWETQNDTRN